MWTAVKYLKGKQFPEKSFRDKIAMQADTGNSDLSSEDWRHYPWPLIDFQITDFPHWRAGTKLDTKSMLSDIVSFQAKIENHRPAMTSQSVYHFVDNILSGELIGTYSDKYETQRIVQRAIQDGDFEPDGDIITRAFIETLNVIRGYLFICDIAQSTIDHDNENVGLIDKELLIQDLHVILMSDLMKGTQTPAGQFSLLRRFTTFEGMKYEYPHVPSQEGWGVLDQLFDRYNLLLTRIKKIDHDPMLKLELFFKCAAWVIQNFIHWHPFSDGNGRLARLLLAYILRTEFPFNVTLDNRNYVRVLCACHKDMGYDKRGLSNFTAFLIQCTWQTCLGLNTYDAEGRAP